MLKNSKISIGSANFGQKYGFLKKSNVNKKEFKKIIDYCQKNKINNFDTASRYKNSESFFKSISKINYKPKFSFKDLVTDMIKSDLNLAKLEQN